MTIGYKLAENKGRVSGGEVAYIGQVIHNGVLDLDAMSRDYAAKFRISEVEARYHLTCLGAFLGEEIAKGKKLNFDEFSVSLKMTGTFSRGNERYDAKRNPIKVVMTPRKPLQMAAAQLEPVNVTDKNCPKIENVVHETVKEGMVYLNDTIRLDGELTTMNACHCKVNTAAPDEGVFLTSLDDETPLLTAEIVENTIVTCDVRFPKSDLPAGAYYILIKCRGEKGLPLVVAKRKVTVVV